MTNEELLNAALAAPPAYITAALVKLSGTPSGKAVPNVRGDPEETDRDGDPIVLTRNHLDLRQQERLPPGYKPRAVNDLAFDPRLPYEIALEIDDPRAVFERYGYVGDAAVALLKEKSFIATLATYKSEIKQGGVSFKLKAKIQAEDLLTHSYQIATDPEAPASVRADLIKWTAKMAGYEPKEEVGAKGGGGSFNLNISFVDGGQTTISAGAAKQVQTFENGGGS